MFDAHRFHSPQIDAGKVHQKKLGAIAKNLSTDYVNKFKSGDFCGLKTSREGVDLIHMEANALEGDAKSLNVLTQTIAKAFPKLAILLTSSNKDGSAVSCRCVVPAGSALDALSLANEAAANLGHQSGNFCHTYNTLPFRCRSWI